MNTNSRIAIIGAGPAGLSTARALKEKGYLNVTVLERSSHVGGQARSLPYTTDDGQIIYYDIGSAQPFGSKNLLKLFKEYNIKLTPKIPLHIYSLEKKKCLYEMDKFILQPSWSKLKDTFKLIKAILPYRALLNPSLGLVPKYDKLAVPFIDFLKPLKLEHQDLYAAVIMTIMSGGYRAQTNNVTALRAIHGMYTMLKQPHHYLFGYYSHPVEGYQSLWDHVAPALNVKLNSTVTKITRQKNEVIIESSNNAADDSRSSDTFDFVILAFTYDMLKALDASEHEATLFSAVKYMPIWRCAFIADTVPFNALCLDLDCFSSAQDTMTFMPFGEVKPGKTLYSGAYCFNGDENPEHTQAAFKEKFEKAFNCKIDEFIIMKLWKEYQPQYFPEEVKAGFYQQLESLQGQNRTYYACEVLHGSSNGRALDYGYDLVRRFF